MTWDTKITNQSGVAIIVNGTSVASGATTVLESTGDVVVAGASGIVHLTEPGADNFHQYIPTTWAVKVISGQYTRYWGYEGHPTLALSVNANGTFTISDSCGISFTQIPIDGAPIAQYAGIYFTNTDFWGNIFSPIVINDDGVMTMGNDAVVISYTYDVLHNAVNIPWQPYHGTTFTCFFGFTGSGSNITMSGTLDPRPQDGGLSFSGAFQSRYDFSLDILSASWGTSVVTSKVRQLYGQAADSSPFSNVFTIIPSDDLFGDPRPGQSKCFTLVWRVILANVNGSIADSQMYSAPMVATCTEGNTLNLNYDGTNLQPYSEPLDPKNGLYILGASFWATDVTSTIRNLVQTEGTGTFVAAATKQEFPNQPYGTTSQLAVTYGYLMPNGSYQYNCKTTWEGTDLSIPAGPAPPRLLVQWADYGGVEFTDQIEALVTFDQTLTLDMTNAVSKYGWTDPWPGVHKSMVILYQWEGRSLELLVAVDKGGIYTLDPNVPVPADRTLFFNPADTRNAGELNIIAMTWGAMQGQTKPVSSSVFEGVKDQSIFSPSNTFFGFDGLPGVQKTACVFFQYGITGQVQCTSAKEDDRIPLWVRLADRSVEFGDPLPAKKLLANFDAERMRGFQLKLLKASQYVGVSLTPVTGGGSAVGTLTLVDTPDQAAIFNVIRLVDGDKLPVLQVLFNQNTPLYVANINNLACLVSDASLATEIHYELPGISASTSILLSFAANSMQQDALVLTPNLSTKQIDNVIIFSDSISQSLMEFTWVVKQDLLGTPEPMVPLPNLGGSAQLVPCTIANFVLLKDLLWDLPSLIAGQAPINTDRFVQGITKWFSNLTKPLREAASRLMAALWAQLQNLIGGSGGSGDSTFGKLWPVAVKMIKDMYEHGVLWSFYGAISKTLSWFDYLLIVGNLLKWALSLVSSTAFPAAPAIFYATKAACWLITTTKDVLAVIKSCSPPGASASMARALAALTRSVQQATRTSQSYAKLTLFEQSDTIQALLNPHWTRIYMGGELSPPEAHLGNNLKSQLGLPGIPSDAAMREFVNHEYRLSAATAATVAELRPQIEKGLIEVEQVAPALLTGPPLPGPPAKVPPPSTTGTTAPKEAQNENHVASGKHSAEATMTELEHLDV